MDNIYGTFLFFCKTYKDKILFFFVLHKKKVKQEPHEGE